MAKYRPDDARAAPLGPRPTMRIDKWLWQARFFKTRTLAASVVEAGHLRLNGMHVAKPAHAVAVGDTLTFAQGSRIRVIRVTCLSLRRGPATEAQALYCDLDAGEGPASPLE